MKTLSLLVLAAGLSIGASAQTKSDTSHSKTQQEYAQKKNEGYAIKDGKLIMWKDGKTSDVSQDVTLANGTSISKNGKVTWQDGKTETLKAGEWVDETGKIHSKK